MLGLLETMLQIGNYEKIFILFSICMISCTDTNERELVEYNVQIKNSSNDHLEIFGFNNLNELIFEYKLNSNDLNNECNYFSDVFLGFSCNANSLVFRFQNNKGFSCSLIEFGNQLCFQNKSLYNQDDFKELGNNVYEFKITQEDFQNAFDLPED